MLILENTCSGHDIGMSETVQNAVFPAFSGKQGSRPDQALRPKEDVPPRMDEVPAMSCFFGRLHLQLYSASISSACSMLSWFSITSMKFSVFSLFCIDSVTRARPDSAQTCLSSSPFPQRER